ncbi:FaeA/PapI family transcriptional regulator [Phaeobacter sp. JH20_09]|uniref:FaeA/PapI family transcriptional regulator n=1 Tax=unclassified Phaeobacter TaxID=2621772 RepID=UPI003A8AD703
MVLSDSIIEHLRFAVKRDAEKGGSGLRTTREIAECAGVEIAQARRALHKLADDGKIDRFDSGDWRITDQST